MIAIVIMVVVVVMPMTVVVVATQTKDLFTVPADLAVHLANPSWIGSAAEQQNPIFKL